jgi:hypothetical protein
MNNISMHVMWGIPLSLKALWLNNNRLLLLGSQAMFLNIRSWIHFFHVFHDIHVRLITRRNIVVIALLTKTTSFVLFLGEGIWCFSFLLTFVGEAILFVKGAQRKSILFWIREENERQQLNLLIFWIFFTSLGSSCERSLWNLS